MSSQEWTNTKIVYLFILPSSLLELFVFLPCYEK